MSRCCVRLVLQALLLYIVIVRDAVPTAIERADPYQSLSQNQELYNSSDYVVVLNVTNFKSSVYNSEHAWIVEFYNSWCGFCQRFAPTWKSMAYNIQTWRDIVTVAALDCANEDNNPLCREYEIMRYPELRYFAPHENLDSKPKLGLNVEKGKDMDAIRHNLILTMQKEQQETRGEKWPNITPYRSTDIKNVWDGVSDTVKFYFFMFENSNTHLATEIILDLHNVTSLAIRRVTSENEVLCVMYEITKFPTLIVLSRDGTQKRLNLPKPVRADIRNVIKAFMHVQGIDIKIADIPDEHPGEWAKQEVPPSSHLFPKPITEINQNRSRHSDILHQADLEKALRFSMGHEISMMKIIDGERMRALKNYTTALASYFPMKRGNPMFLSTISFVVRSKESISGADFGTLIASTEQEMSPVYSERNEWIGCKGSKSGMRGYPCGLWTLFHTMTVNFAVRSEEHPDMEPTQILSAMHGYVKNFFGCADCAQHFVTMAGKNKIFEVTSADESVLWLWKAHNEVNKRLAGDDTEDPESPKIQYPSPEHCSSCRDETGEWNETEVLAYLKKKYSYSGIKYESSTRSPNENKSNRVKPPEDRISVTGTGVTTRKFSWDFTIFDISICVVLYVASAAILILVCIKFAVKRSSKKKLYIHSLLGKV